MADNGVPGVVHGPGPMFSVYFTNLERITASRQVQSIPMYPHIKRSAAYFRKMLKRGVLAFAFRLGRTYVSFAHPEGDIKYAIESVQARMEAARAAAWHDCVVLRSRITRRFECLQGVTDPASPKGASARVH